MGTMNGHYSKQVKKEGKNQKPKKRKGLFGGLFKKKEVYRYEMWGKDTEGNKIFNWIGPEGNWIEDDHKGRNLPRNAVREFSDTAYKDQKERLEKGTK